MRQYDKAKEYIDKMLAEKMDDQSCEACELNFMSVSYTHLDVYKRQFPYNVEFLFSHFSFLQWIDVCILTARRYKYIL